ncbi:GNAT family N-acetyltransferase [Chryseolinea lacunae]|uniref:N-acetyltransferase n=1 Tax=Chryseolinea lacunae TaxID=2801331 RepID=A0ABS1L0J3_9BACT|nr:GNAT family N-acetyltransferase [Chryseolinea lacunae]MBL0745159.1 N-acetyltransferase [Chryseolinea lacunae]
MNIKFEESETRGSFFVEDNGVRQAEMIFTKAGATRIIINHTEVSDALRGQSAGKQLVAAAVDYARTHALKIFPLCPFAKSVFDKTAEYQDVLDK